MSLFEVKEVSYGGFGPVSFKAGAGERIGVTGPSGCGKTRLLRALADLDPWEGEIRLAEAAPHVLAASAWRRRVSYLPAESQWWADTVREHFAADPEAGDVRELGLDPEVGGWPVSRLSSGEKQRLSLLRTLVNRPAVLLLDEPTAHLDEERARAFEALVLRRCERDGMIAVWVAHDAEQLARVSTRGYRMAEKGTWREVPAWA